MNGAESVRLFALVIFSGSIILLIKRQLLGKYSIQKVEQEVLE